MLYIEMIRLYLDKLHDTEKSRQVYQCICNNASDQTIIDKFRQSRRLGSILYIICQQWDKALHIIRHAIHTNTSNTNTSGTMGRKELWLKKGLQTNLSLWNLVLEESLGTVQTTKDVYHAALDRKVATPNHIVQFTFLFAKFELLRRKFCRLRNRH